MNKITFLTKSVRGKNRHYSVISALVSILLLPSLVCTLGSTYVLTHLHQSSLLLRTLLSVLDECRAILDSFAPFPGKADV